MYLTSGMQMKKILLILLALCVIKCRCESVNVISKECKESSTGQCETGSSETNENDNAESKDVSSQDCSQDQSENEQTLVTLKGMLKKGEEEINKQQQNSTNTILVLGNAGAGKTTFVQFMAGNNNKLISKEKPVNSGNFVIEDGIKIGNSVTESFTLYPDTIKFTNDTSLTDTPGFKDTRSRKHEIVESYLMKKFLKNIKKIKIVLVITSYSLEHGAYKDDLINLLHNVNNFIKDVDKYKHSIALIATKVPSTYKTVKNNVTLITDEQIISNIAEYLTEVEQSLNDKLYDSNEAKDVQFFHNAIAIIGSLLEKDGNSNYKKINIFRRPLEPGALSEMELLQKQKESLRKTIDNIDYSQISEDNIGYTLSHHAKNYLNCLSWYMNDKVTKLSLHTFQTFEYHYESKIKNYTDIYALRSELEEILQKLKSLKNNLKLSNNYNNYSSIINKYLRNENITIDKVENTTFLDSELHEYITSLQQFTNMSKILSTVTWSDQMKSLKEYIKENVSCYKFLIKSFELSSSYQIQNMKSSFLNTNSSKGIYNYPMKTILTIFDWFDKNSEINLKLLTDDNKKIELSNIISITIKEHNNVTCDNGKLIISGYYIKFSEINNENFLKRHCKSTNITVIGIYAIHSLFIDADFKNDFFRGVDIMIAAPKWEVIGNREININGIDGKNHEDPSAKDGEFYGDKGEDGSPGLPGGNGGNFFGIGLHFINEANLIINADGGTGGSGQNGGTGHEGESGKSCGVKIYESLPNDNNYNYSWTQGILEYPFINKNWLEGTSDFSTLSVEYCQNELYLYLQYGDCGQIGAPGGNGGVGGLGGLSGNVVIIGEKETLKFFIKNSPGTSGKPGKGGNGGKIGENGKSCECFKMNIKYTHSGTKKDFWMCITLTNAIVNCEKEIPSFLNGLANYSTSGIQQPNEQHVNDFSSDLNNYILLLKSNENNKFLVQIVKKMHSLIVKKLYSMKNLFWRFIFLQESTPPTV